MRVKATAMPKLRANHATRSSRFDDLPDLYVFECRACGVWHIEEASLPDLATVPGRDLTVPLSR